MKIKSWTAQQLESYLNSTAGFLTERRDYLHVSVEPSVGGSGYDVMLRVDGTYSERVDAEMAATAIREWMERLADVNHESWNWWGGPPWLRKERRYPPLREVKTPAEPKVSEHSPTRQL